MPHPSRTSWLWLALVAGCAALYLMGLGGAYAPTNGDEMVYIHIARMTAESGHWLPLQSELLGTRNTKPPLLIWQAMVAGGWGSHWNLFYLRLPSVLYTFATTTLIALFAWRFTLAQARPGKRPATDTKIESNAAAATATAATVGSNAGAAAPPSAAPATREQTDLAWRNACLAAALYLLFFSTFRYGRAYLTSAPETFWLALPLWWVLWLLLRPADPHGFAPLAPLPLAASPSVATPGWWAHTLFGIAMGLGAAYKSFALLAPSAATLWCVLLVLQWPAAATPGWKSSWKTVLQTSLKVAWSTALGLGLFALWFVLDPDPAAVWQEFVLAENAGKMSGAQGYWHSALFGAYPMWTQLLAYPANAGLLFFAALGYCLSALRHGLQGARYAQLSRAQWVLLLWLALWLIIFTIPSQRSERYVIPAMPALAIVMAFAWHRIKRLWHGLTLLVCAPALVLLARIGWVVGDLGVGGFAWTALTLLLAGAGMAAVLAGLMRKAWTSNASLLATLAVLGSFGCMVQPLSNPQARYSDLVQQQMRGQKVAVPNGFTGQYERFHFLLPGARITPFDAEGRRTGALYPELPGPERLDRLMGEFDAVVWLQDTLDESVPPCLSACQVLARRWHVKSRHKEGEVTLQNLWYPQQWLFRYEWLLTRR